MFTAPKRYVPKAATPSYRRLRQRALPLPRQGQVAYLLCNLCPYENKTEGCWVG
jgi:hypothetical protein